LSEKEGIKHDTGKPDLSLVPLGLVEGCARAMMFGVGKYGRDNWRGGFNDSRLLAACLRHIMAYTNGERIDAESGLCHLDCASFSLGVVLDQIRKRELGKEVGRDDLQKTEGPTVKLEIISHGRP
jgi:hypothetical protein